MSACLRLAYNLTRSSFNRAYSTSTRFLTTNMPNDNTAERLAHFRDLLHENDLDAYLVGMEDYHFSEYLSNADKRIEFISGFTGSAGTVVITLDNAALWTDGRYHAQAAEELDENWLLMKKGTPGVPSIAQWLTQVTRCGAVIGFDVQQIPYHSVKLHCHELAEAEYSTGLNSSSSDAGTSINGYLEVTSVSQPRKLHPCTSTNLVDIVWEKLSKTGSSHIQRPKRRCSRIFAVPVDFAGHTWQDKLRLVRATMREHKVGQLVVFALDEIAWLLNLRASDISHNPVFLAYAVITNERLHLFVDTNRPPTSVDISTYLNDPKCLVNIHEYSEFFSWLCNELQQWSTVSRSEGDSRIWLDPSASYGIISQVPKELRYVALSPIATLKTVKAQSELLGSRRANLIDSVVLCDFLAWLEEVAAQATDDGALRTAGCLPCHGCATMPETLDEVTVGSYLDQLRGAAEGFVSLSFPTISGADANGATIHYVPTTSEKSAVLTRNSIYLVDSGGQYLSGTTDVTRVLHLGTPTSEQKDNYTRVLKSHIGLAQQIFPTHTVGSRLDILARRELWRNRQDYQHGTGHGVGAFLCVHEGPIGLWGSRSAFLARFGVSDPGLQPNMIVTIEPGYYAAGEYGIRLENVVVVVDADASDKATAISGSPLWLAFDPLTLVPFQRKFIQRDLLSKMDIAWIDDYHATVLDKVSSRLHLEAGGEGKLSPSRQRTMQWLQTETQPL